MYIFILLAVCACFVSAISFDNLRSYKLKLIIAECRIPVECRNLLLEKLESGWKLEPCASSTKNEFYVMEYKEIFPEVDHFKFRDGEICCNYHRKISNSCKSNCEKAFFSPSLIQEEKKRLLSHFCSNSDHREDADVLDCANYAAKLKL